MNRPAITPLDVEHTCHAGPYCAPHYDELPVRWDTLGYACDHESCVEMDLESCAGCFEQVSA